VQDRRPIVIKAADGYRGNLFFNEGTRVSVGTLNGEVIETDLHNFRRISNKQFQLFTGHIIRSLWHGKAETINIYHRAILRQLLFANGRDHRP